MQDLSSHYGVLKEHGYNQEEALIFMMRLQLVKIVNGEIRRRQWTQREAAKFLGIAQPRVAELSVMVVDKFSIEMLIKILHRLNLKASISIKPGKKYIPAARRKKLTAIRLGRGKGGRTSDAPTVKKKP
ncbi:MAG: helix-turn-helix domain-containing protein [Candidatus Obscuribacterales bacterium]|nr:helix-turn-helix domain-containing protein [Candidatus Obscuribacterales bacterium]